MPTTPIRTRRWLRARAPGARTLALAARRLALGLALATVSIPAVMAAAGSGLANDAHRPAATHHPAGARGAGNDAAQWQQWVEQAAAATWATGLGTATEGKHDQSPAVRVVVSFGDSGVRLQLAPCKQMEPFLPPNTRLWGRSYVGVRCVEGASWSTLLPVTVSVFGPALVAALPIAAGAPADPQAFRVDEVDWTRTGGTPVNDPALLDGRALARPLSAGQVLRAEDLRVPQTVFAGDPVRIRMIGKGFAISTEGFALAGAGEGQRLRVRTGAGKLLMGTVRARAVEVRL